jgi:purine-binding chemotaxis protein CheW
VSNLESLAATSFLLCRGRSRLCALPLDSVVETMRPLPIEVLPGCPPFVRGVAVIRGKPTPVADLGVLLGAADPPQPVRFVMLKTGGKQVALSVEAVLGIRELTSASLQELPALLREASVDVVSALGTLDVQLLLVLEAARMIPPSVWQVLEAGVSS